LETKKIIWLTLFVVAVALTLAATRYPYFPGDVPLARFVQSSTPIYKGWARWVTITATQPWNFVLAGTGFIVSWAIAGWRAALLSAACFGGMWLLGPWLNALIARPRPSANLIHVAGVFSGYSFPSSLALTYASTFGFIAVLAATTQSIFPRWLVVTLCCAALVVGGAARIALGAHWPSDIILSYLIALLWASLLIRLA
jgi:undecaprenyl-diphosphatase